MSQLINLPWYKRSQWQSLWALLTFSNKNSTTFDSNFYPLFYTEGKRYSFWYLMSKWIVLFGESLLEIAFHFLSILQNSYDFTLNTHALRIKVVLVLSLFDTSPVICFGFFKTLFVLVSPIFLLIPISDGLGGVCVSNILDYYGPKAKQPYFLNT